MTSHSKRAARKAPKLPARIPYRQHAKGPRFPSGAVPQRRSREDCPSTEGNPGPPGDNRPPNAPKPPSGNPIEGSMQRGPGLVQAQPHSGRHAWGPVWFGRNPTAGSMHGPQVSFGRSSAAAKPRGLSEHRRIPGTPGRQPPAKRPQAPKRESHRGQHAKGPGLVQAQFRSGEAARTV